MRDEFTEAYATAAVWSESDWRGMDETGYDNPLPLEDAGYTVEDLDSEAWRQIEEDCAAFQATNAGWLRTAYAEGDGYGPQNAGHDFLLTRNGHGAGFWDRGGSPAALRAFQTLTADSKAYGEFNLDSTAEGAVTAL